MNIWKTIVGLIVTSVLSASVYAQSITCEEQLNAAAVPILFLNAAGCTTASRLVPTKATQPAKNYGALPQPAALSSAIYTPAYFFHKQVLFVRY